MDSSYEQNGLEIDQKVRIRNLRRGRGGGYIIFKFTLKVQTKHGNTKVSLMINNNI